jgi:hypothetical protein
VERCELDSSDSGCEPVAGSSEQGNEPSDSLKGGKFLEQLRDYQLLKKNFAWWSYSVRYLVYFNT